MHTRCSRLACASHHLPRVCVSLTCSFVCVAAVSEDLQDQEGLGQEGQAEQTYSSVDQVQDRQQDQVGG